MATIDGANKKLSVSGEQIEESVGKSHEHSNKEVLDLLSESDTGKLQYNGVIIGGEEVDLSGYATVDALKLKADLTHTHDQYLTEVPDEYITETKLNAKGYLTEHQDISNLALKSEIPDVSSFITSEDLPTVPTKVSELTNDKNYISSIPSEYITETELNAKGYLTSHQDISGLQPKTDGSLTTTDKTVIGAINELKTNISNINNGGGSSSSGSYEGKGIDHTVIDTFGTEILKYPLGVWRISDDNIASNFTDLPVKTSGHIEITSINPDINNNPWDNSWGYRVYNFETYTGNNYFRKLASGSEAGVFYKDTGWQKVCSTTVADVPKTTLTPVFPNGVIVGSGGVVINYIVRNGWCNVDFEFNVASASVLTWNAIATGLPKPANNVNIVLVNDGGKINRTIPIKINSNGSVALRVPAEISTSDWWCGNISYPVAE